MNIKKTANLLLNFAIKRLAEIFGIVIFFSGLILLISLLAMFSVRVRRRRKEKRLLKIQKQELLQSELTEVAAVEVFGSMDSPVVVANESYFEKDDNENDNTS